MRLYGVSKDGKLMREIVAPYRTTAWTNIFRYEDAGYGKESELLSLTGHVPSQVASSRKSLRDKLYKKGYRVHKMDAINVDGYSVEYPYDDSIRKLISVR